MSPKVRCTIDKRMMDKLHKELSQMEGVAVGWDDGKHYSGLNYATLAAIHSEGFCVSQALIEHCCVGRFHKGALRQITPPLRVDSRQCGVIQQ